MRAQRRPCDRPALHVDDSQHERCNARNERQLLGKVGERDHVRAITRRTHPNLLRVHGLDLAAQREAAVRSTARAIDDRARAVPILRPGLEGSARDGRAADGVDHAAEREVGRVRRTRADRAFALSRTKPEHIERHRRQRQRECEQAQVHWGSMTAVVAHCRRASRAFANRARSRVGLAFLDLDPRRARLRPPARAGARSPGTRATTGAPRAELAGDEARRAEDVPGSSAAPARSAREQRFVADPDAFFRCRRQSAPRRAARGRVRSHGRRKRSPAPLTGRESQLRFTELRQV